jgi:putative transposase
LKKKEKQEKRLINYQEKINNETSTEKTIREENEKSYNDRVEKRNKAKEKKIEKQKEKCLKDNQEYEELAPKIPAEKTYRVKIYPSTEQKQTLRKWFGARRWIYNRCLALINSGTAATLKELRTRVINNENFKNENKWMLEYDYDLRDEALQDLLKNIKSNKTKGSKFKMQFKSRHSRKKESISVLGKKWNKKNNFYSSIFKPSLLKSSETLPEDLKYTSRLLHTATNRYFLCIPKPLELQSENQAHNNMIFIDPGMSDFLTGYDPSGKVIVCGEKDNVRIARLLHYRRKLHSKISKEKRNRKKKALRLAMLRIYEKIDNLVKDLHKKLALWLCTNYKKIYIPRLNFHTCKNLPKRKKCVLAALQHCAFVDRLIYKSREFPGCEVVEVNEAYTSKTCSNCGYQKEDLGKNRVYKCNSCSLEFGRDINASRNVMLRYFTKVFKLKEV